MLIVLNNTDSSCYFSRPNNLASHDLTKGKVVPLKAKKVLGLSRNFIPTKKHTAAAEGLEKSQFECRRDAHLKTFFSGSLMDHKPSTLYTKPHLVPPSKSNTIGSGQAPLQVLQSLESAIQGKTCRTKFDALSREDSNTAQAT